MEPPLASSWHVGHNRTYLSLRPAPQRIMAPERPRRGHSNCMQVLRASTRSSTLTTKLNVYHVSLLYLVFFCMRARARAEILQ